MQTAAASDRDGTDDALIQSVRAGDEHAFEALIRRYGGRMLSAIRRILTNADDVQESLQEAFLSAFRSIDSFSGRAQLSTWLHRIAVNTALMKLRSLKRRKEVDIDSLQPRFTETGGHFLEPPAPWSQSPEAMAEARDDRRLVHEAIAALPDGHRQAILLRDIQGLSTEEVAGELGVNANAAKIRVHRARLALRALLDPHLREER